MLLAVQTADESVSHILTGCTKIAQTEYMKKHNSVAVVSHKNICDVYNIETTMQHDYISLMQSQKQMK